MVAYARNHHRFDFVSNQTAALECEALSRSSFLWSALTRNSVAAKNHLSNPKLWDLTQLKELKLSYFSKQNQRSSSWKQLSLFSTSSINEQHTASFNVFKKRNVNLPASKLMLMCLPACFHPFMNPSIESRAAMFNLRVECRPVEGFVRSTEDFRCICYYVQHSDNLALHW